MWFENVLYVYSNVNLCTVLFDRISNTILVSPLWYRNWRSGCYWLHFANVSQVSSIRESRTDDRRFSIFTGTKRLHLRAETREDRMLWMEALRAMKELFPRVSNNELMAPSENVVVSTEKLRQRLSEEGISESAIQDSEQIMKSEFTKMHSQLMVLKQRQVILVDALRHLEVIQIELRDNCAYHLQWVFIDIFSVGNSLYFIIFIYPTQ